MFENLKELPPDPILALTPAFRADPNPARIDLGAGVYKDEKGDTPVMRAVKQAERILLGRQASKAYVGPGGAPGFNEAMASLAFGEKLVANLGERRVSLQTPGGCGGLRLAAEFIAQANSGATVWLSGSDLAQPPAPARRGPAANRQLSVLRLRVAFRALRCHARKFVRRPKPATCCCSTAAATIPAAPTLSRSNGGRCATWSWTGD